MLETLNCIGQCVFADGVALAVRAYPAVLEVDPDAVTAGSLVGYIPDERVATDACDVALQFGVGGFNIFFGGHVLGGA